MKLRDRGLLRSPEMPLAEPLRGGSVCRKALGNEIVPVL